MTEKIISENYDSVINVDESGLCYDPNINFTLDEKGKKRIEIETTGREKERVTMVVGVDYFEHISINPYIIFRGTTTKCIKGIPLSDAYEISYQKNSWCDSNEFIKFLSFLPNDKKILLLCDNYAGHKTKGVMDFIKTKLPLTEILFIPANITSILQPLDVGINKALKSRIKTKYITWLANNFDEKKTIPKLDKQERNKLLVEWVSESWDFLNNNITENSFHICGYDIPADEEPKWKKFYNE